MASRSGVRVTLDNLYPLKMWPEVFRGREIFLRIDPGFGRGHHSHVRTGGRALEIRRTAQPRPTSSSP